MTIVAFWRDNVLNWRESQLTSKIPNIDVFIILIQLRNFWRKYCPKFLPSMEKLELSITRSNSLVKPTNPYVNDHEADKKILIRTTNLKRSREVCLFNKKLINIKLPDISTALLLSQKVLRWCLNESHSVPQGPKVKAGRTVFIWQLDKLRHKKLWLYRDWECMELWVSSSPVLCCFFQIPLFSQRMKFLLYQQRTHFSLDTA